MERLRVDEVLRLLPELDELQPWVEGLLATSAPDEGRRWTASGELETVGQRVVSVDKLESELPDQLRRLGAHLERVYGGLARAVRALERGDRAEAARELITVAEAEESEGRSDRAEAYARSAYETGKGERAYTTRIHAQRIAARAARAQGRLDAAVKDYEGAYRTAIDAREPDHAAVAAIGRGNVAIDQGRWKEAERWYMRALGTLGEDGPSRSERWHVYVDLSIAARRLGDLDSSRSWLTRAEEEAATLEAHGAGATLANARGRIHQAEGRPDLAEDAFRRALELAREPAAHVTVGLNLADALLASGRTLDAAEAARVAEALALRRRVFTKLPEVYRLLGRIASARDQSDAFVFFERALQIIDERRLPEHERAETLEAYAGSSSGDGVEARERLLDAASIYERLGSESAAARVRDALLRLGTEVHDGEGDGS